MKLAKFVMATIRTTRSHIGVSFHFREDCGSNLIVLANK